MQSPWQQKPIKVWNFIATKWHLLLPRMLKLLWSPLGRHTPECLLSARVRVWHKWTVRHEKKFLTHVKMKTNYIVGDVALKRSFGHLDSHCSDKKAGSYGRAQRD